jgi:homoserine O-succinyltransferase
MTNVSLAWTNEQSQTPPATSESLVIGVVNNMGDAALETTEQQFRALLEAAGVGYDIRLRLFSFPQLIRNERGRAYVAEHYEPIERLWAEELDGLIVTGAEPRATTLPDEAYWRSLTRLIERACETATPTVCSCLAAHAAVLYLDGIHRQRIGRKLSGVFRCGKVGDDPLAAGLPATWRVPHSRLNTLDPAELVGAGYEIVSFSEEAGVDTFTLRRRAQLVFYQGHPEYDAGALFREYRRDVGRFLAGTTDRYPDMPRGYFDDETVRSLETFRERANRQRTREILAEFPATNARERIVTAWHDVAVRLYRNWLALVLAERRTDALLATGRSAPVRST